MISTNQIHQSELVCLGSPPWDDNEIREAVTEFEAIYDDRPIRDNSGGMRFPHLFATWFMVRSLQPSLIVESGVFKGQGTWVLEQACPDAELVAIDIALDQREYISSKAEYLDQDFSEIDWSARDLSNALAFFDDHQNAYARLQLCKWFGFNKVIFEDNYPVGHGDFYSLKRAFAGVGFEPVQEKERRAGLFERTGRKLGMLSYMTPQYERNVIAPNTCDRQALLRNLRVYYEFPPVFRPSTTRWGDPWSDSEYPTPSAILDATDADRFPTAWQESQAYTWICYAELN